MILILTFQCITWYHIHMDFFSRRTNSNPQRDTYSTCYILLKVCSVVFQNDCKGWKRRRWLFHWRMLQKSALFLQRDFLGERKINSLVFYWFAEVNDDVLTACTLVLLGRIHLPLMDGTSVKCVIIFLFFIRIQWKLVKL